MAKYVKHLTGNFTETIELINNNILHGSISASFEDGNDFSADDIRCAVRVYERYSTLGGNRVSLNVTLVGKDGDMTLTAITSGGSQALFFKINTVGEEAFLRKLIELFE